MPRPSRWTCAGCRRPLGLVDSGGTLVVDDQRVEVRTEAGRLAVIVMCSQCSAPRRWSPALPGMEIKTG